MKKLLIILLALAAAPVSLCAEQWQVLGTRPMGMGGAFVAVAQGPIAQYWNPAGLVKSSANVSGMDIPAGVTAEFTGDIIKNASEIGDLADSFSATQADQRSGSSPLNARQLAAFAKTVSLMNDMNEPGKGALFQVAGGVNFKFSKVALSVNNFTSVGLNPFIDTVNIGLDAGAGVSGVNFTGADQSDTTYDSAEAALGNAITTIGYGNINTLICGNSTCLNTEQGITSQANFVNALINTAVSDGQTADQINEAANTLQQYAGDVAPIIAAAASGSPYTNNNSNLEVVGASFVEIAAGYAWNKDNWLQGLSLGANLKAINGRTAVTQFRFMSEGDTSEAFQLKDVKSSWQPSADLGFLWNVRAKYPNAPLRPRLGLVIRNITSPSFKTSGAGRYDLDRQARLGLALNPAKFWTLAMDLDLTRNKTPVRGFDSRQLSLGTEINLVNRKAFNIPLRAGLMSNLAEKDSKLAYTLGTGINLLFMHFDVSGVVSSERTRLDDRDIPTKVGVAASFGLLF